jgi:glycerophosphoryl diester phosphodiesterase
MKKLLFLFLMLNIGIASAKPLVIAHRGASFVAPENTAIAYKIAFDEGAKAAECDIFMTKDNQIILSHDRTLERIAGTNIEVTKVNYDEIKDTDAGSFKGGKYKGEPIPLLDEVLELLPFGGKMFIEIKDDERIVPHLAELLNNSRYKRQSVIIAFDFDVISASKKALPDVPHYWLIYKEEQLADAVEKAAEAGLDGINSNHKILTKEFISKVHENNMKCYTWTVNDIMAARRLADWNIDGITTDRPAWMNDFFDGRIKPMPEIFSHNDYAQPNPMMDAISNGCHYIEVDVHNIGGKLWVSHDEPDTSKAMTIEQMYFFPFMNYVMETNGQIFTGFRGPVVFMIDIKGDGPETYRMLKEQLMPNKNYVTRVENGQYYEGMVTVFVSGNRPIEEIMNDDIQLIAFDGRPEQLGQDIPAGINPVISDRWSNHFSWKGEGKMPQEEFAKLREMADKAKAEGKKLRLWANPDNENTWRYMMLAGVELINTDKPAELREFLIDYHKSN